MTAAVPSAASVSALGAAAQALLDREQPAKAARVALAALAADPTDRFTLGFLARQAAAVGDGDALLAETLARLAAADPRAQGLLEAGEAADDVTRAQRATWILDLGHPARARALADGAAPVLLLARGRACRALGDLGGAAAAYAALLATRPDQAEARSLLPCLRGVAPEAPATAAGLAAVPFWRIDDPLAATDHRALREAALARLADFRPARVHPLPDQAGAEQPESRRALRLATPLAETRALAAWLEQQRPTLLRALLGDAATVGRLELQVTLSGAGDFYKPHRDAGDRATGLRLLTVVLYLHRKPRGFAGGDLRLYDSDLAAGHWLAGGFTLIPPDDATLLVFPAAATHEITPISGVERPENGRLTVNGWFHRAPDAG